MKCRYLSYEGMNLHACKCGTYPGMVTAYGKTFIDKDYANYYCKYYAEACEQASAHGYCQTCGTPWPASDDYCRYCSGKMK